MRRPCFLVIDPENAASISTRKLIIEAAQMNVITAYSNTEGLQTLERFPNVDGIVLSLNSADQLSCDDFIERSRDVQPDLPVIVVRRSGPEVCRHADHFIESFEPQNLLTLVQRLVAEEAEAIVRRQRELAEQQH